MIVAAPEPKENMGQPAPRVDGRLKVTGQARYPADVPVDKPAQGFLVTSTIARGRIVAFDLAKGRAVPGVLDILTHENTTGLHKVGFFNEGGPASTTVVPLGDARIWHEGQIIALVVADSYEAAREAAHRVKVDYEMEEPAATFGSPGVETKSVAEVSKSHEDPHVGDVEAALAGADRTIDVEYSTPTQHHNPMELFSTTCVWTGDRLTVYEPSQFVHGMKNGLAAQLGIDANRIRFVSSYVGGAFGSKGSLSPWTAPVAIAARRLGRPVRLVLARDQGYTVATYRAETRHHIRLGARADGRLVGYSHEGWEVTSRSDAYSVAGTDTTCRIYAFGAVSTKVNVVRADRNTPGFMRSPAETPYVYALESAMDEMAVALGMDPVEFRRVNDTMNEPIEGKLYTSRSLMQCYDQAAAAFGWSRRNPEPGSMRDGQWLVGWGCATAVYPTYVGPAAVRIRFWPDGQVRVQVAAHDLGTGAYTVIGQMAAQLLGVALEQVTVELGDSDLPPAPVAGGSNTTATVCSVVKTGCDTIRAKLFDAATMSNGALAGHAPETLDLRDGAVVAPNGAREELGAAFDRIGAGAIEEYAEFRPQGAPPDAVRRLYKGGLILTGGAQGEKMMHAFGAEFVEVKINALTGEIRVPRAVGAFAAGHIMNTRTARSQLMGGMIWGIGSALHEATEIDIRAARYINDNIAEYLVPVNADIAEIEVILVPEIDHEVNPAGVKGVGELGNVGTAAAIANAVYHATGRRIRDLPIRIEDVI